MIETHRQPEPGVTILWKFAGLGTIDSLTCTIYEEYQWADGYPMRLLLTTVYAPYSTIKA
jgi:hypothetical protein